MKKIISFIVLIALVLCAFPSAISTAAVGVEGEAISSESDFLAMSTSGSYYLEEDITISSSYENSFSGTLDGNGKTLKIADGSNVSPFKKINNATIKNITVEGIINVTSNTSYGGVAVEGNGSFENVIARVGISAMVEDSFNSVGASQGCFIAKATGNCTFKNCTNEASVTVITQNGSASAGSTGFGGFIGEASNGSISFDNCFNNAAVTSLESRINVGGFIGISSNAVLTFKNCDNDAIVVGGTTTESGYHIGTGGFIGNMSGGSLTVENCSNTSDVQTVGGYGHTGGCIGRLSNVLNVTIDGFRNMHAVYNTSNTWEGVGGLVGMISDIPVSNTSGAYLFRDCVNSGWVQGSMAGGLVGIEYSAHGLDITFERCANLSEVKTLGSAYAGGIIGRSNGALRGLTFKECLNTGTVTTNDGGYGVGGIMGNIGEEQYKSNYSYTPIFENCVNTGEIACKTTITTAGNVVAAGILSRTPYISAIIRNCVNLGTLTNSAASTNVSPIAPNYSEVGKTNTVSNCSYLSGSGGASVFGESAKTLTNVSKDVVNSLTSGLLAENNYYNYRNSDSDINSVGEGVDKILSASTVTDVSNGAAQIMINRSSLVTLDEKKAELVDALGDSVDNFDETYTAGSYAEYLIAYENIYTAINEANDAQDIDAIDVSVLKANAEDKLVTVSELRAELLSALGEKKANSRYTASSYAKYSEAYDAIVEQINSAGSDIDTIDVATLKLEAESKLRNAPVGEIESGNVSEENGYDEKDVWVNYEDSAVVDAVYSVDVVWTDITFTYNAGSVQWNPEDHEYNSVDGAAGWSDSTGEIIVTNHSDVAVEIDVVFVQASTPNGTAMLTVATPSFTLESAVGTLSTEAPSGGTDISVSGIPNGDGIMGKLKVTVKAVSDD